MKKNAPGEARTHGLQIMRLTRCLLRYGGLMKQEKGIKTISMKNYMVTVGVEILS